MRHPNETDPLPEFPPDIAEQVADVMKQAAQAVREIAERLEK